jgi:hypothetical protein
VCSDEGVTRGHWLDVTCYMGTKDIGDALGVMLRRLERANDEGLDDYTFSEMGSFRFGQNDMI